jgi:hypothetical protein
MLVCGTSHVIHGCCALCSSVGANSIKQQEKQQQQELLLRPLALLLHQHLEPAAPLQMLPCSQLSPTSYAAQCGASMLYNSRRQQQQQQSPAYAWLLGPGQHPAWLTQQRCCLCPASCCLATCTPSASAAMPSICCCSRICSARQPNAQTWVRCCCVPAVVSQAPFDHCFHNQLPVQTVPWACCFLAACLLVQQQILPRLS